MTKKHDHNYKKSEEKKSNIHVGYRIGALVLVIIMAVSLIAMYSF